MGLSKSRELNDIIEALVNFRDERDWNNLHTIKDLCISVSIEASELVEITQWKTDEELESEIEKSAISARFEEEIADTFIYLLLLCEKIEVDPIEAIHRKIERNRVRFPK